MRKIFYIVPYYFKSGLANGKSLAAVIMIVCIVYVELAPMFNISVYYSLNVNIAIIAVMLSDGFSRTVLFLAVLLIFSNLPLKFPPPYFLMVRSGKRKWIMGQVMYVILTSLAICVLIYVLGLLFLRGRIFVSSEWGKIIHGITGPSVASAFQIQFQVDEHVLTEFTASQAMAWTTVSTFVSIFVFGLIAIALNLTLNEYAGTIANGIIVFMNMLCEFYPFFGRFYFSPLEWCSINVIDTTSYGATPGIVFIVSAWGIIITTLLVVIAIASRRNKDITTLLERVN